MMAYIAKWLRLRIQPSLRGRRWCQAFSLAVCTLYLGMAPQATAADIVGRVVFAGNGLPLDGFVVTIPGDSTSAVVGADGSYALNGAPELPFNAEIRSSTGVFFGEYELTAASGQTLSVEASGQIYASDTGAPAMGVTVQLVDQSSLTAVSPDLLSGKQQGQQTDKHGLYRLDINTPGDYRIQLLVDSQRWHYPSTRIPPSAAAIEVDESGRISGSRSVPSVSSPTPYTVDFSIEEGQLTAPRHNHIPVDPGGALVVPVGLHAAVRGVLPGRDHGLQRGPQLPLWRRVVAVRLGDPRAAAGLGRVRHRELHPGH